MMSANSHWEEKVLDNKVKSPFRKVNHCSGKLEYTINKRFHIAVDHLFYIMEF